MITFPDVYKTAYIRRKTDACSFRFTIVIPFRGGGLLPEIASPDVLPISFRYATAPVKSFGEAGKLISARYRSAP